MPLSGDAIIDVMQVMSLFASGVVFAGTVKKQYEGLFTQDCARCRGTGMIICQQCRGTKSLRRRPGEFYQSRQDVRTREGLDVYPCQYCGPQAPNDIPYPPAEEVEDDEDRSLEIWDNVKDAMAGRRVRLPSPLYSGTVQCPECHGVAKMQRHTANWRQFTGQRADFQAEVLQRRGRYAVASGPSAVRRREYFEYPNRPPHNNELDPERVARDMLWAAEIQAYTRETEAEYERETGERVEKRPYEPWRFVDDSDTEDED